MSHRLPDGGAQLRRRRALLYERLQQIKKVPTMNLSELGAAGGVVELTGRKGLTSQARMLTSGAVEHLHV